MTNNPETDAAASARDASQIKAVPPRSIDSKLLPGMAIISLWMLLEAGRTAYAVYAKQITGQQRFAAMGLATILLGCGIGLMQRRRWGWALTLAMTFLSLCFFSYLLMRMHAVQFLIMTFVNAVLFLYLVRPEIRVRLRN